MSYIGFMVQGLVALRNSSVFRSTAIRRVRIVSAKLTMWRRETFGRFGSYRISRLKLIRYSLASSVYSARCS